jgi:hypothetical protein
VQRVRPAVDARRHALAARLRAHVAGRPDAALERPGLEVEGVGIGEAAHALQAHRERPALARQETRLGAPLRVREPRERDRAPALRPRAWRLCSTSKVKRVPRSFGCARSATSPVTSMSRPFPRERPARRPGASRHATPRGRSPATRRRATTRSRRTEGVRARPSASSAASPAPATRRSGRRAACCRP